MPFTLLAKAAAPSAGLFDVSPVAAPPPGTNLISDLQWNNLIDILDGVAVDKISAASIAGGLVSDAEFDFINNVGSQVVGESDSNTLTNKTLDSFTNDIRADEIHIQVRNESGGTINIGDAVYISGYSIGQDLALVQLADASVAGTMPGLGIVESASIANNANGTVLVSGRLSGFDTSAFSAGDTIYVSNVGTTGNTLTNVKPTGTDLIQSIGIVLRSHASQGRVEITGAGRSNDIPNVATHSMDMAGFNLTKVGIIESNQTPVATVGAIRLGHVVDDSQGIFWRNAGNNGNRGIKSGTNTLFFGPGWNSAIFDSFTTIDMSGATINAAFIQIDASGGIDLGGGDITSLINILMDDGGAFYLNSSTTQFIQGVAAGMQFYVPTADTFDFFINSISEYEFTATQADWHGNNLINVAVLESNALNPAQSGAYRLGDTEQISWRNNANTADLGIKVDNDQFVFNGLTNIQGTSVTIINAPSAAATFDSVNVTGLDLGGGAITSVSEIDMDAGNILMAGGYVELTEIATPANPAANKARLYARDDATVTKLFFRDSAGTETELGGGGGSQTPWTANIDADGFDLTDLGHIQMRPTTDPGTGLNSIYSHDVDDMTISVAGAAGVIRMRMNTSIEYTFKNNTIEMNGAGLTNPGNILDSNNNELLQWTTLASAVNYIDIGNAATGAGPLIATEGSDTNIDLRIQPKGFADGSLYLLNRAIKMGEQSTPTAPGGAVAKIYVKDVSGRSHLFIQDDVGEVDIGLALFNVVEDTTPVLGGNLDAAGLDITDVGVLNFDAAAELTIATGAITRTQSYHTIDTEADAATDDLDTISGGVEGDILVIRAIISTRTVSVTEAGNIKLSAAPFALDNVEDTLTLIYDGTNWLELSRSDNGA